MELFEAEEREEREERKRIAQRAQDRRRINAEIQRITLGHQPEPEGFAA